MQDNPRISELLVKTGAFKDLEQPVILTSGELGIYYINTEKLLQDKGKWKEYGEDSLAMISHAINQTKINSEFNEVIEILTRKANSILQSEYSAISGGQRRDWIFSGPVAARLGIRHLSIYKDGKIDSLNPNKQGFFDKTEDIQDLLGTSVLHIADLLTEASSCYRKEEGIEKGWTPEIRKRRGAINDLLAIVTRQQGGEERLKNVRVRAQAFVTINEDFIKQYSKYSKRDLSYMENPRAWSESYLEKEGALALLDTFNPQGDKLARARKFLDRYGTYLAEVDKWNELSAAVNKEYGIHLGEISGDID